MKTKENKYKLYFLILLLGSLTLGISYGGGRNDFFTMTLCSYSYIGTILILICLILYNTIIIVKDIDNNYLFLCRFKNIKQYYKFTITRCIKSNLLILLMFFLLNIIVSFFFCYNNFKIPTNIYNQSFILIFAYWTLKLVITILLFIILSIFIYKIFNKFGILIYSLTLILCNILSYYQKNIVTIGINSLHNNFSINFVNYLTINNFATLSNDIKYFSIYLILLLLIIIVFYLIGNKKKDIN